MKKITSLPWHILLLPVFYTLHVYNEYFGIYNISLAFRFTCYYLALAAGVFLFSFLLLKNKIKGAVWTSLFLLAFFFFGATHDFLKTIGLPKFFVSYTFLLPLGIIFFIFLGIRLKKSSPPAKSNRFFGYLFIMLFLLETAITLFYIFSNEIKKKDPAGNNPPLNLSLSTSNENQKPDIFFMVFDEYTSSTALKKYYHFDNSGIDSALVNAGFFISTNSQSNYNATSLSIGSTFNLQYFNKNIEKTPNNPFSLLRGAYSFKNSLLPDLLEKNGYDIINHGLCDIKGHPVSVEPLFTEFAKRVMYYETLWGRIKKDIYWNLTVRLPGYNKLKPADMNFVNRNRYNYTNFLTELGKEGDRPKFVYGHVAIPHRPACVDRHGNLRMVSDDDFTDANHDKLYVEQVIYANTWIDSLAKAATTTKRSRPLVLIIEGDHGNRYAAWGRPIREKQFMNLNAYYFSDKDYTMLYDSISPVNSFRVVLNKYFQTSLPLLKDSTIRLAD
ncbi:sulfatase-like hydrolase/transferase [Terrimonas pollutisoli]|uniref:sulfatase-like hydrolase/transferase n=1 Tax=Terrimonas pollutisoli TaxID=3034147 RepID=UPI0023EAE301|nr:sulfatase-like hydrolase/transferase [Terrimonas sp. H1YJ31]